MVLRPGRNMGYLRRIRRFRAPLTIAWVGGLAAFLAVGTAAGQSFRHAGTEFDAKRTVAIKPDELRPVMVVEFLHQALIRGGDDASAGNVVVTTKSNRLVPVRILQLGPGDFCRLAFETISGKNVYEIYYGGQPPKKELLPKWTNSDGLILETRRFGRCNLRDLDSLRRAFEKAEPIGADYVQAVFHSYNPMSPTPGPFLSRYWGTMHIAAPGNYTFWTSSRDCSFVLIDGDLVVAAPGRHGPLRRARPASGKSVRLSAGPHKFECYHAAAGNGAIMSLAWLKGPAGDKPRPTGIEPAVFRATSIGRAEAGPLSTRAKKKVPDFRYKIAGEVPLPGETRPLVGVSFQDASPPGPAAKSKFRWDFGDGQTSDRQSPEHVYLRPGLYTVSLSIKRASRALTTTNRIHIGPLRTRRGKEKPHKLDDYLAILSTYDARKLDVVAARQLVLAFLWKSQTLAESQKYLAAAVAVGSDAMGATAGLSSSVFRESLAFTAGAASSGTLFQQSDRDIFNLAQLVGPLARNRLGDSKTAFDIWQKAASRISRPVLKARCELTAADIAIGDLLLPKPAKELLDRATAGLPKGANGPIAARLHRVWGDYWATMGEGAAARKAYAQAQSRVNKGRSHVEKTAWRGAHSRSVEQFLKSKDWARAMEEIGQWQASFPADKIDGYLTLLLARYWNGRGKYARAVALAEQLITVNPDSPYADQLLLLAAACEKKQKDPQRASAILHSIINDYPGSPLVPTAKKMLDELQEK